MASHADAPRVSKCQNSVSSDKVGRYCTGYQGVGEAENVRILLRYTLLYHRFRQFSECFLPVTISEGTLTYKFVSKFQVYSDKVSRSCT